MNRKQSQNRKKTLSDWLKLFYLQAEQNDTIPLLTKILPLSATPLFALNSATSGNTVYKPPLAALREAFWHEAVLQ
jgi:hypothetical protein